VCVCVWGETLMSAVSEESKSRGLETSQFKELLAERISTLESSQNIEEDKRIGKERVISSNCAHVACTQKTNTKQLSKKAKRW